MDFDAKIPPNFNDMARNLWSQLDSMAKNNPRGYKELMSKIEEEAKKTLIPVLPTIEPCFSIKLEGTIISGSKVHYINFCKCNAVEESTKENDGGIPIVVREEDGKRKYKKYGRTFHVYDVSFNENILKRAEADPFFKRNLIFMAINCVEQVFNLSFKKDFTVTEEKYNGTFIHGHTSREGQPMPTLSQEEVNELLKNSSTILNQNSEEDEKGDKKNSKKKSETPIDLTPENILKQHKTYQKEMMENEKDDKINPEIESTMEKLFFSDENKDNSEKDRKNKKNSTSKNKSSLIEEMTEIVPDSKKTEGLNEEEEKKKNNEKFNKNKDETNKKESKNQFIELEGNGIPKIIDLLDDNSSNKKEQQNEKDTTISEAESKIFDFLKEFDNNSGKITELDESNNEVPPSKIEEINENDELPPSKIEEINENDELPPSKIEEINENDELPQSKIEEINKNDELPTSEVEELKEKVAQNNKKNDKQSKIEECIKKNETTPIVEEPTSNNDPVPIIEEPNSNNETLENDMKFTNHKNSTPIIEEIEHDRDITSNIKDINSNNDNTPKFEEITHDNELSSKNEENSTEPKIEEPSHLNDKPIIEEPLLNDKTSNNESNKNNKSTPFIEELTPHSIDTFDNIPNDGDNTPKIEDITYIKENNENEEINKDNNTLKKESIQEQLEREQKQLIEDIKKLSINTKNEDDSIQFKTIEIPVKEKPKYLLKTSEHYLYIKVKLPKLKLIKSLQWNLFNCEVEETRPSTEKWLNVSSPEYNLRIRLDTQFLDLNNIRVTFTKSTQMLILRFNRILN